MSVRVSGKHMEIGEAFRNRIEDAIAGAIGKYFDGGYGGQVTVEKEGSRFDADCRLHLDTGVTLHATGKAQDPQASFDMAAERIEKRLRRYKRRLKDHHLHEGEGVAFAQLADRTMETAPGEDEEVPVDYAPTVVAEQALQVRTMTVAGAVMALDLTDEPLTVFTNAGTKTLNIVYRRADGHIGWIDTAGLAS
ncbi:ribosome hibernation-promoting factor, HPF/YfiA family [Pararhizobium mangrovi]|uniref:Ribosome hibernation promoting factor n=1 Tax=Pararhizobium mangrovi TaxID=2590452 RepID=A0A506U1V6_9HYPH|nr:ribosome-associated translation inhibitor RaiA [Pararhizobium mangrovi]TPW28353.1 ribosome-associated translation inhibitor RaiA [Pararhizobium mangrovi]